MADGNMEVHTLLKFSALKHTFWKKKKIQNPTKLHLYFIPYIFILLYTSIIHVVFLVQ